MRASDVRRATVHALRTGLSGERIATLRLRHAEYRVDRWWSFCDVDVVVPAAAVVQDVNVELRVADEIEIVLSSIADASRVADGPGHYSCRLHPASEAPVLPPERATDSVHGGLVERTEPPASGDLVLHLGSGLTCYPQLTGEGPFPPDSLRHGEWSEFILIEPHAVLHFAKCTAAS